MRRRDFLARLGAAAATLTVAHTLPALPTRETDDERVTRLLRERGIVYGERLHLTRPIVLPDAPGDYGIVGCVLIYPDGGQWMGAASDFPRRRLVVLGNQFATESWAREHPDELGAPSYYRWPRTRAELTAYMDSSDREMWLETRSMVLS